MNSHFITVEGGEYVGKTSLIIPSLAEIFKRLGFKVLASREPGGSEEAEKIRTIIFQRAHENAPAEELALLFNKARKIHLEEVILPFKEQHKDEPHIILLDRYLDSTRVYQGLEGGLDMKTIFKFEEEYIGPHLPDFTYILHIPEEKYESIIAYRQSLEIGTRDYTAFDKHTIDIHIQRQKYYMQLPDISKQRREHRKFFLIDAASEPVKIIENCMKYASDQIPGLKLEAIQSTITELQNEGYWDWISILYTKQETYLQNHT